MKIECVECLHAALAGFSTEHGSQGALLCPICLHPISDTDVDPKFKLSSTINMADHIEISHCEFRWEERESNCPCGSDHGPDRFGSWTCGLIDHLGSFEDPVAHLQESVIIQTVFDQP